MKILRLHSAPGGIYLLSTLRGSASAFAARTTVAFSRGVRVSGLRAAVKDAQSLSKEARAQLLLLFLPFFLPCACACACGACCSSSSSNSVQHM